MAGQRIAPFDPLKTWSEYLNRLLGVVLGLEVLLLLGLSFGRPLLFPLCLTLTALVGLQGLLGARVVSSGLASETLALHLLLALVILFLLHFLLELTSPRRAPRPRWPSWALPVTFGLGLFQFFLGIFVRQEAGLALEHPFPPLGPHLGWAFLLHRSHALLLLMAHGLLYFRAQREGFFREWVGGLGVLLVVTAATGASVALWPVPAVLGAFHLLGSCLYLGGLFSLCLWALNLGMKEEVYRKDVLIEMRPVE